MEFPAIIHDSIQTTGKYLGVEQDLTDAPKFANVFFLN
jgi:hypothetical protein